MWNRGAQGTAIPTMGVFPGGEERVGEYEGRESYLWVGSVGAGVARGGPAAEAVARMAMAILFRRGG